MERNTFGLLVASVDAIAESRHRPARASYRDRDIVLVYFWAVLHDRPTCWACRRQSWPFHDRMRPLPSGSTVSRRLRTASVQALIQTLETRTLRPKADQSGVCFIDAKPLVIGGNSGDRSAGFGRSAGAMAKGYKLHLLLESSGQTLAWEVLPMNKDERPTAVELIARMPCGKGGIIVGDGNYDASRVYEAAAARGYQLVANPRRGASAGRGHRRQNPHRLRGIALARLHPALLRGRSAIERHFGSMGNRPGGLCPLPNWVRRLDRVRRWVGAKLILDALQRQMRTRTEAA